MKRAFFRRWVLSLCAGLCALALTTAQADTISTPAGLMCPDGRVLSGLIKNVCWKAMLPIRLLGTRFITGGATAPEGAANRAFCVCGGDLSRGRLPMVGFTVSMYLPLRVVEIVRKPYCFPSLPGGLEVSNSNVVAGGSRAMGGQFSSDTGTGTNDSGFYNFHYLAYPLAAMMNLFDSPSCNIGGFTTPDVLQLGEIFPNWYNDELGALLSPENILFANPIAVAAAPVDCANMALATVGNETSDNLYWVAGCWGGLYPLTGRANNRSLPRTSSLLATRAVFLLSRLGFVKRTIGNDVLCEPQFMPILRKSQYKMQMLFPVVQSRGDSPPVAPAPPATTNPQTPEVDPSAFSEMMRSCAHPIGKSTLQWGEWRSRPATGEDAVYLMFQWVDCCVGGIPGL